MVSSPSWSANLKKKLLVIFIGSESTFLCCHISASHILFEAESFHHFVCHGIYNVVSNVLCLMNVDIGVCNHTSYNVSQNGDIFRKGQSGFEKIN